MRIIAFIWMLWFAAGSIAPGNDFTQVFMLFNLDEHYAEHCDQANASGDEEFGFLEFISMHYSDHDHRRSAHDEDDHLPLHGVLSTLTLAPPSQVILSLPETSPLVRHASFYIEVAGGDHLNYIFRPPHS